MKPYAEECCKAKGVSTLCLGYCSTEPDNAKSSQRSTACTQFHDKIEACMSVNK